MKDYLQRLLIYTVLVFLLGSKANAATISTPDITIHNGENYVTVPITITPQSVDKKLTSLDLWFTVEPKDDIGIIKTNREFDSTIWTLGRESEVAVVYQDDDTVRLLAELTEPQQMTPDGLLATIFLRGWSTKHASSYRLEPNAMGRTVGNIPLNFERGTLTVLPEPRSSDLIFVLMTIFLLWRSRR